MKLDIEEHYDKIYRYCYFKLKDAHLAEDVTQETFLRFLESDSYQDAGRPLAFLYTVARNLCVDEYRRKKPEELPDTLADAAFEKQAVERVALLQSMEQLTAEEKELLLLRYVNEAPMDTLCRMYGCSRFVLYRRIKAITKKLERGLFDEA